MKISLFYEFPLPRPWGPDDERILLQGCLDEVEAADKAGFSTVWLTDPISIVTFSVVGVLTSNSSLSC